MCIIPNQESKIDKTSIRWFGCKKGAISEYTDYSVIQKKQAKQAKRRKNEKIEAKRI